MDASSDKIAFRLDLRRQRAQHLTALLWQEIEHLISYEKCRDVHGALFKVLFENGAAWTTEDERAKLGFHEGFQVRLCRSWPAGKSRWRMCRRTGRSHSRGQNTNRPRRRHRRG